MELSTKLQRWRNFIERLKLSTLEKQVLYDSNIEFKDNSLRIIPNPKIELLLTKDSRVNIVNQIIKQSDGRIADVKIVRGEFKKEDSVATYLQNSKGVKQDLVQKDLQDINLKTILSEFPGSKLVDVNQNNPTN